MRQVLTTNLKTPFPLSSPRKKKGKLVYNQYDQCKCARARSVGRGLCRHAALLTCSSRDVRDESLGRDSCSRGRSELRM